MNGPNLSLARPFNRVLLLTNCILVCLFFAGSAAAQSNCDCGLRLKLRPQIGFFFNQGKIDSAELLIEQLNTKENPLCLIAYYDSKAQICMSRKDYPKAYFWLLREKRMLEKTKCSDMEIRHYNTFVRYYQDINRIDSASLYAYKAIQLGEQTQDWYSHARACTNLAVMFGQLGQLESADIWYKEAMSGIRKTKDSIMICATMARFGSNTFELYKKTGNPKLLDTVYMIVQEAIGIGTKIKSLLELADAYDLMAKYYFEKKSYQQSLEYADKIIQISPPDAHDFKRHIRNAYLRKTSVWQAQGNTTQALRAVDSAYRYSLVFNQQLLIDPLAIRYKLSKATGDFPAALYALEEMKAVEDSIFTAENRVKINELEQKYNQTANERSIQELKWRQRMLFLICTIILGICLLIFFYFRNRNLRQKQVILEIEQRLNRARMNPHFFFNALSSLQSFAMNESNPISLAENLSKFSHIMRETLENTYRDYVTIRQEIDFLYEYISLQQIRFPDKFEFNIHVADQLQPEQLLIPSMIVQPFIENSIEHGFKGIQHQGKLNIQFSQDKDGITIQVNDNGKGLQYEESNPKPYVSRASQIIKDRIYLLNLRLKTKASFIIDTNPDGQGVSVEISLPLIYENKNTNR